MWATPQPPPSFRAKIGPERGPSQQGILPRRDSGCAYPVFDEKGRTRVWMNEVKDKVWFLREGLFAKYVVALVGLVVFVLAVNGALETWISYRGIKTTLRDAMSEKAEATAKRIEQSMSDLDRQIGWVTRASSTTTEQRRADYAQLLNQVPAVYQLTQIDGEGRETLRLSRQTVSIGSNADFSRDLRFTETLT